MKVSSLRIAHLRAFKAVAASASMQVAARSLGVSQPAISKFIKELEDLFGTRLFVRGPRGVTLTETGSVLASRTELLLADLAAAHAEVSAVASGAAGRVTIGALPVMEPKILPLAILEVLNRAPAITLQVEVGTTAALLEALARGEIDCVLGRLSVKPVSSELTYESLLDLPIRVVVGHNHALAGQKRVSWRDLAGCRWIMPGPGPVRIIIEERFAAAGSAPPAPIIQSTATQTNAELVSQTDLVGVMGVDAATAFERSGMLKILDVPMPKRLPPIGVVFRTGHLSRAARTFLDALRETTLRGRS